MVPPNACPNPHYTAVELAASQMSRRVPVASSLCRSAKRQRSTREKRKQRFVVIVPFWPALSAAAIALAGTFTAYVPRKRAQERCQEPIVESVPDTLAASRANSSLPRG